MLPTTHMFEVISHDPLARLFQHEVISSFPAQAQRNRCQTLEVLTDILLGSNQTRLGPKPKPESLVEIRKIVTKYTDAEKPIPFMIPWGSEKPDGTGVDLAELSALKTLQSLNARIREVYPIGAQFNIRIEDASAPHLFYERTSKARAEAKRYTEEFVSLVEVMGLDFVKTKPESKLTTEAGFNREADDMLTIMEPYVRAVVLNKGDLKKAEEAVQAFGWKGSLEIDTANYYIQQFMKMPAYAEKDMDNCVHVLARYMAGVLARTHLKLRGDESEWEGQFLDLSFVQQAPGVEAVFPRRLFYRTLPASVTSNHIPAWRAKGYFLVANSGDKACVKLASFNNLPSEFVHNTLTLQDSGKSVTIQADYILD